MPSKLPRRRDAGSLVPATPPVVVPLDTRTALILGGAHVAHGVAQSSALVASTAITATSRALETSIQSFGNCVTTFIGYMREREITKRVITQEREITARVIAQEREITARAIAQEREITARVIAQEREKTARIVAQEEAATERVRLWSAAVIAEAEARTEEVRTQAVLVLAAIEDKRRQRDSKLEVIHGFMAAYQEWNSMLTKALANRADRMPLDERELLQRHIDTLLERAREMERNITTIAVTL